MSISIDGSGTITGATTMASTIASPTLTTPALGIPSSGTVTNLTGTASININGTVGATTPATGAFTTGTFSGQMELNSASIAAAVTNQRYIAWYDSGSSGGTIAYIRGVGGSIELVGSPLVTIGATNAMTVGSTGAVTIPGTLAVTGTLSASGRVLATGFMNSTNVSGALVDATTVSVYSNNAFAMAIDSSQRVGIGTTSPNYKLEVSTDSAGKPGTGGLWTVVSDERIKANIVPADLDRCYEIVKSVPLKHFGFAPGVYTDDQIHDKHNLGWIAQDVQKVFKHAVSVKPFTLKTAIPDGTEDYEEQDFTLETVEETKVSIEILHGKPVQVSKTVSTENKVLLFDTVDVLDEAGEAVMNGDTPVTHQMPRMVTKTRPKVRHEVIEDCLDLNSGQMIAALYGAVQALMAKVDTLETKLAAR